MLLSMFRTGNFDILVFLYSLLAILVAISFHEYAHALTATRLGDDTPRLMGRLTVAPMKHIDPIGFISLMLVGWGWAKPVTINPRRFKNLRRDEILVSLAGPGANLLIALVSLAVLYVGLQALGFYNVLFIRIFLFMYLINIMFMLFNLLPIPPLDGYHIFKNIFIRTIPYRFFATYEQYGMFILIAFVFLGAFSNVLGPIINWSLTFLPQEALFLLFFQ